MFQIAQKKDFTKLVSWAVFICIMLLLVSCKENQGDSDLYYPLSIVNEKSGETVASFEVERAVTALELEQGLMNREELDPERGMIFIYPQPRHVYFWMRNTFIPLDIIFIDTNDKIINIHQNAKPHDLTPIPSGGIARSAIEINAGLTAKLGVSVGDKVIFNNYP